MGVVCLRRHGFRGAEGLAARNDDVDETLRRQTIEARLAEAQSALTRLPRGSTAYKDGLAAVR